MSIYLGTDLANFIAQLNADNPQLPWPINDTDFIFGKPQVIASPTDRRNTTIKVTAKGSSKYRGSQSLNYERIDLAKLFRSMSVSFTRWVNDGSTILLPAVVPLLNQMYGLNLEASKMLLGGLANGGWNYNTTGTSKVLAPILTNLMYIGSVPVVWNRGLQEIGIDILTVTELSGEQWPGGNDFSVDNDRSLRGEFLLAGVDLTEWVASAANTLFTGQTSGTAAISTTSVFTSLLAAINAAAGTNINTNPYDATTNPQGLGNSIYGLTYTALPNATFPSANKPGFAFAAVMNLDAHPTFKGKVNVYYNI